MLKEQLRRKIREIVGELARQLGRSVLESDRATTTDAPDNAVVIAWGPTRVRILSAGVLPIVELPYAQALERVTTWHEAACAVANAHRRMHSRAAQHRADVEDVAPCPWHPPT